MQPLKKSPLQRCPLKLAVLCGGLATRLAPLGQALPKSLMEVAGKPFILHQLELFRKNGLGQIVLCAGFLGQKIQNYLGDGKKFGLEVKYSFDGEKLLGTGGAIKKALPLLGEVFWVMYGDSYLDVDFQKIYQYFLKHCQNKLGLMVVFKNEGRWDKSNLLFEKGRIVKYNKKKPAPEMKHIDYGLAILRKEAFGGAVEEVFDLADLYQNLVARCQMLGFEVFRRFYEIGSFTGLRETRKYFERNRAFS